MAKLGKATLDAYTLGGWLILKALLKNWVAEGVTSEVININVYVRNLKKFRVRAKSLFSEPLKL